MYYCNKTIEMVVMKKTDCIKQNDRKSLCANDYRWFIDPVLEKKFHSDDYTRNRTFVKQKHC